MLTPNPLETFVFGDRGDIGISSYCVRTFEEAHISFRYIDQEVRQIDGILSWHRCSNKRGRQAIRQMIEQPALLIVL